MAIILASSSPQRKKILKMLGLEFRAIPADIDEHHSGFKRPHAIVKSIAKRKAEAVSKYHPDAWVIGCDTIVLLSNGDISVKPKNRDDAGRILKTYQNSYCDVYSGLAFMHYAGKKCFADFERTRIHFRDFSDESMEEYLDTGEWQGRSGAMTIEGKGHWTSSMEGEYWNVVGLPVDLLKNYLKKLRLLPA
ncbi:septum formation protein Maf [Patescibacteria group bacterium]|nr:septum formation protein Maf [Patescibacteria group bacterium]MBU1015620.1 septum formation protein Maf [Patescibacteria group bacterium]MBU1685329.1 septum formation protein Maf [Patescibacteria group bacterium]MBU1938755.1 septum formation protein Maf [Patescibacteria group bacterium]